MADRALILPLNKRRLPPSAGSKALNLRRLAGMGLKIPKTWVIPWQAYVRYIQDDVSLVEELHQALQRCLDPEKVYAVRSSANIEDQLDLSFAGQFKSMLNMCGIETVFQAIWSVWASTQSDRLNAYLEQHSISPQDLLTHVTH